MNVAAGATAISGARRRRSAGPRRIEAELVVHLAFLGVREDFVGFLNLLELLFGGFVAGIQVRVILAGQLAVGRANFFRPALRGTPSSS